MNVGGGNLPQEQRGTGTSPLHGVRVAVLNFREPQQFAAGGAEEYIWQVSRYLIRQGARVDLLTAREPGQAARERRDGVSIRRMGTKFTVYLLVPLWLLLRRRRFDAVVDCMNGIPFFAPAVVPRRTPVVCLVHHVHDRQFHAFLPKWLARIGCFIEGPVARRLYRRSVTVTVSESSRASIRERLRWLAPIVVVPNGSPEPRPGPVPAQPSAGDPAVVYVGRLVGHKRVDRLVHAVRGLRPAWPGLRLHIVGRGPEYRPLRDLVQAGGLRDLVHIHGFLGEDDKRSIVAGATLNVTASEFEGWGLTVIEAAALGIPSVAYDVEGLRDSIRHGETGWLVREGEELADVVDRALKELADPLRRAEVGQACRSWASRFTWERTGAAVGELLVAEPGRRGGP
ncbi:glycosyltransferase family 4 protein [Rhizohabitans arisaemae]|uniref:glycosyltransferase family 4 protein n=1 Tax=Rhizohabitans arisaemae TaxID=2720610 RepID=UPI0024B10537|nr:glycosyltransferase family 4 protein [Rhizohabitans arisaemae]